MEKISQVSLINSIVEYAKNNTFLEQKYVNLSLGSSKYLNVSVQIKLFFFNPLWLKQHFCAQKTL